MTDTSEGRLLVQNIGGERRTAPSSVQQASAIFSETHAPHRQKDAPARVQSAEVS
jgi:hypothetical protein